MADIIYWVGMQQLLRYSLFIIYVMMGALLLPIANGWTLENAPVPASGNDDPFKDWISLNNYMESQGLGTGINWAPIEKMCMSLMQNDNKRPYNQCKYERAYDSIMHNSDRQQCFIRAVGIYPDSLKDTRIDALSEVDERGISHHFERTMPAMSAQELESRRYGEVVQCMQSLGWLNADNWALGKRKDDCGNKPASYPK